MPRTANWEEELLGEGISKRTRRVGGAYTGPGSGFDSPQPARGEVIPIGFMGGVPAPECFPVEGLRAAADRVLREQGDAALAYGGDQGFKALREWLAAHWSVLDNLELTPDNFALTNGSGGALNNICETFLDEGDLVLMESPTFPGSIRVIRSLGTRIESVEVDDDGLNVDSLADKLADLERRGEHAKLLYTIPNYHNPTGSCLTLERRYRLLELTEQYDVLVVEDDAYGELGYDGKAPPSLSSISGGRGVIKAGSFSKIVAPGLRVGWCQAAPAVIQTLLAARFDMGGSPFVHRTIAEYAKAGELERHIEEIKQIYKNKRDLMLNELRERCTNFASWRDPLGGFFVWLELSDNVDPIRLHAAAEEEGIFYMAGQRFLPDLVLAETPMRSMAGMSAAEIHRAARSNSPFVRLAFSQNAEAEIPEGIRRLGRAMARSTV